MEKKNLNLIKNDIGELLVKQNLIVTSVSYVKEGNYNFLRIELDKVNGIDLDMIVEATNIINPLINKYKFLNESYILDVISKEKGDVKNG